MGLIKIIMLILTIYIVFIFIPFTILKDMKQDVDIFCENKTGLVDTCDYIDYKWYQPHQCMLIDCDNGTRYLELERVLS